MAKGALALGFLGSVEVARAGLALALPPSKKTRALLAYLVLTGRPHRRERLCSLFWDVTDDPRGALRWSLSKLRTLVDDERHKRIIADRDQVEFHAHGAEVDVLRVRECLGRGLEGSSTEAITSCLSYFRGELLEGLDLPDFDDFQAWCIAEREELRRLHARALAELVKRLADDPNRAVAHARAWTRVEPLDERARAILVRLLMVTGHREEAEQQYNAGLRLFKELGTTPSGELVQAWQDAKGAPRIAAASSPVPVTPSRLARLDLDAPPSTRSGAATFPLVGRGAELERLLASYDTVVATGRERFSLVTGEPGIGKSRLLHEVRQRVRERGGLALMGACYEAERARPYGPWLDALGRMPASTDGMLLAAVARELRGGGANAMQTRDRLFSEVAELLTTRAQGQHPVLVVFDDLQWCDDASATLLHYVARVSKNQQLCFVLGARGGELADNAPASSVVRSLRRDRLLDELPLGPLSSEDTGALVSFLAPDGDLDMLCAQSGGNPLFALELARATERDGSAPHTLTELIRERLERLPAEALDLLRWGAVLGATFAVERLQRVTSLAPDRLVASLELLERHGLIRVSEEAGPSSYAFAHDLLRAVAHSDLSEPRRRLMHARVADALDDGAQFSEDRALEVAHHASLAGDAARAARAHLTAARQCMRMFASTEAAALAKRGLRHADGLAEPERVRVRLELMQASVQARHPEDLESTARELERLAETAAEHGCADHARLAFQLVSELRFQSGRVVDAEQLMLRAERVSRGGDERENVAAVAEAARCLVLLERDLPEAERMLADARARAEVLRIEPTALVAAEGLLRTHQGQYEDGNRALERAHLAAREAHDREVELHVIERLTLLEWEHGDRARFRAHAADYLALAERVREGSEAPFARGLVALGELASSPNARRQLDRALDELRGFDAKQRLLYLLTRAALEDDAAVDPARARTQAREALELARLLDRASDIVLSFVALVRATRASGDELAAARHLDELKAESLRGISALAERAVEELLDPRDSRT